MGRSLLFQDLKRAIKIGIYAKKNHLSISQGIEQIAQMQRQLRNAMQDLGVPRQAEMDELRGRVDRLERQLRDIENKLWR